VEKRRHPFTPHLVVLAIEVWRTRTLFLVRHPWILDWLESIKTRTSSDTVTPVFPKKTKCKPICMPGSSFMHIVSYKCIQKQYHERKREIIRVLRLNPGNEGTKLHKQSTGGYVRLEPATSSQDFRLASSFWATLFMARVSTCRTQQVWGKFECKGFIVDWL
jgi:hypothetical protein